MKILLINNQHYLKGGAHKVYLETGKLLSENGNEVYYFSQKNSNNLSYELSKYWPEEIDFRKLTSFEKINKTKNFFFNKEAYENIKTIVDYIKPDIAHIHLFMGGLSSSILKALKEKKIPIVHTVHDYRLICPTYLLLDQNNKTCERCKGGKYYNCVIHKCSENNNIQSIILSLDSYYRKYFSSPIDIIDKFIFVSEFSKNKHIEFEPKFQQKSSVLFNFNKDINSLDITKTEKGNYFLFIGRLSREKGIKTLVEATKELGVKLKIAGNGPLFDYLKRESHVELLGFKEKNDLNELIKFSRYVVFPSECFENNPMTIIETFSLGKPVIGSKLGGIPELVKDGKNGFLFEHGNKESLKQVLIKSDNVDEIQYKKMCTEALEYAENHFQPRLYYETLTNIYKNVIYNFNKRT